MLTLSNRNQFIIGTILVMLVVATRGQHIATLQSLPGASWAAFFLAGVYLRPRWVLPGLLALTWILDFAAYTWGGASGFCITPAYVFLLPAYSALWFAGRWYAGQYCFEWRTLLPLSIAMLAGGAVCKLFSSGGFYFFSGRFTDPTFIEFGARLAKYFPLHFQPLVLYVSCAALIHVLFSLASSSTQARNVTTGE